jgi:hypothetical protein
MTASFFVHDWDLQYPKLSSSGYPPASVCRFIDRRRALSTVTLEASGRSYKATGASLDLSRRSRGRGYRFVPLFSDEIDASRAPGGTGQAP